MYETETEGGKKKKKKNTRPVHCDDWCMKQEKIVQFTVATREYETDIGPYRGNQTQEGHPVDYGNQSVRSRQRKIMF